MTSSQGDHFVNELAGSVGRDETPTGCLRGGSIRCSCDKDCESCHSAFESNMALPGWVRPFYRKLRLCERMGNYVHFHGAPAYVTSVYKVTQGGTQKGIQLRRTNLVYYRSSLIELAQLPSRA